jgi:NAD(P)-dependent dehydrogenase (short-subunit alcohol dehydrogenase family)
MTACFIDDLLGAVRRSSASAQCSAVPIGTPRIFDKWWPRVYHNQRRGEQQMDLELKGKRAVISGGSVGIGLAVAHALAAEGVEVAILARDKARVEGEANAIGKQHHVRCLGISADVSVKGDIDAAVGRIAGFFDGVDILINNAGTGTSETIMDAPDEKWNHFWELHVMAAIRLSRAMVPQMRKRGGGVILNTASICAKQPLGYEPIYNTTKAALVMMSKCLANELIKDNIRVNAINPGLILTRDWIKTAGVLTEGTTTTPEQHLDKIAKDNAPIGRFATPEELAHFYVFMCSSRASYCVGSSYYVDGGWLKTVE